MTEQLYTDPIPGGVALLHVPLGLWGAQHFIEARHHLGFTQAGLAQMLGYTRQGVGKIESGESPVMRVVELAMRWLLEHRSQISTVQQMTDNKQQ